MPRPDPGYTVLNKDQAKALAQLLEAASRNDWPYFMAGGWAGEQLMPLVKQHEVSNEMVLL